MATNKLIFSLTVDEFIDALREGLGFTEPILDESSACIRICQNTNIRNSMMKDAGTAIGLVGSIRERLANLKEETKEAIISLTSESCEVDMSGFHIRQSFSYYDEEVYHQIGIFEYLHKVFTEPIQQYKIDYA